MTSPRSYFTHGCAFWKPGGRPSWVAEVQSVPNPLAPGTLAVTVKIGGLLVVQLAHVPIHALARIEALIDALHLDRAVKLLQLKP